MISPEAFGTGLAKGSSSLLKGTLGGVMSAASSVTNSASKAMATASGDESFVASQAAARSAHQPEHLADGLKMGVHALGSSLFSGVTGVFLDPLAGAKKEGLLGFGKGLAKGIAGVVFKPLSGVLDLTTNTLKGIGPSNARSAAEREHCAAAFLLCDSFQPAISLSLLCSVCLLQATPRHTCLTARWRS